MSKRRRSAGSRRLAEAKFWRQPPTDVNPEEETTGGGRGGRPATGTTIRPSPDPSAMVRSLGPPPLALDASTAERHLRAVYEEAVRTATALAAANGLLAREPDDT